MAVTASAPRTKPQRWWVIGWLFFGPEVRGEDYMQQSRRGEILTQFGAIQSPLPCGGVMMFFWMCSLVVPGRRCRLPPSGSGILFCQRKSRRGKQLISITYNIQAEAKHACVSRDTGTTRSIYCSAVGPYSQNLSHSLHIKCNTCIRS